MSQSSESSGASDAYQVHTLDELRLKRRELWVSSAAVAVPLLLGVLTLVLGVWGQQSAARLELQLKAVEIVMNAEGPYAAKARAQALVRVFGPELRPMIDTILALDEIGAPGRERRLEILRLLAEHPQDCLRILETVQLLFRDLEFVNELRSKSPYCRTED